MEVAASNEEVLSSTPCSSPDLDSNEELSDSLNTIPESLINAENYITFKEGCQSAFTVEELKTAVEKCKKLVLESEECSVERKWLVRRLIELRHRLEQAKETQEVRTPDEERQESFVKLGHHFSIEFSPTSTTKHYCDQCCGTVWNMIKSYYQCTDCQYMCHIECVDGIHRICAHLILSERPEYEAGICPEVGLDSQGYCCYECKRKISYCKSDLEARLCDYNGHHYCPSCHWNTTSVIPARIRLNWDFEPRKVSRASYLLLRLSKSRPLITLDERLYAFIDELALIKKLREDILLMKKYIASCRLALESGLMKRELEWKRHLVHSTTLYSLDDLCDIYNKTFLPKFEAVYSALMDHIKVECDVCKGRGHLCELCSDSTVIFGFDRNAYICPKCESVSHKFCWNKSQICKKCIRKEQKVESDGSVL